jgi:DnaJ-class molecular chaperone
MGMVTCRPCKGTGQIASGTCPDCGGTGMVRDPEDDEENPPTDD